MYIFTIQALIQPVYLDWLPCVCVCVYIYIHTHTYISIHLYNTEIFLNTVKPRENHHREKKVQYKSTLWLNIHIHTWEKKDTSRFSSSLPVSLPDDISTWIFSPERLSSVRIFIQLNHIREIQ